MIRKLLLLFLILCVIQVQNQNLKVSDPALNSDISIAEESQVYSGSIQITVPGEKDKKIQFSATLVRNYANCSYSKCYFGWVNNYVNNDQEVVGYGNQAIYPQPVFEFKTNSERDFIIIRNPNLSQVWVQIIEIFCEKINPQIAKNPAIPQRVSTAESVRFTQKTLSDAQAAKTTQNTVAPPEGQVVIQKYQFKTLSYEDLEKNSFSFQRINFNAKQQGLTAGDRIAIHTEPITLKGFKAPISSLSEVVVLNSQELVKTRTLSYQVKLETNLQSADGTQAPSFEGLVNFKFNLKGKEKVPSDILIIVQKLLSDAGNRQTYKTADIEKKRACGNSLFNPIDKTVQVSSRPEDAQIIIGDNQKILDFNIIDQLNKVQFDNTGLYQSINTDIVIDPQLNTKTGSRLLQAVQNYTIYNYRKVLFSRIIFGRTFQTDIEVKCYLLVYSNDHKVQCTGKINYNLFGNSRSVEIFNFIKSIHISWNFAKNFSGSWPFSVYIPLPPPVSFIGINFSFTVSYSISLNINVTTTGSNPLVYRAATLATTQVNTDASAAVRVVAIQGGVYITGTLVRVGTDPTITLSYYINQRYINVLTQWYFWINAFQYEWGFFYRTWGWSGWSGRRIISRWTINGVYGRWTVLNNTWNIYL